MNKKNTIHIFNQLKNNIIKINKWMNKKIPLKIN